eukprot:1449186-Alexandrium_andersonii.AAC.1
MKGGGQLYSPHQLRRPSDQGGVHRLHILGHNFGVQDVHGGAACRPGHHPLHMLQKAFAPIAPHPVRVQFSGLLREVAQVVVLNCGVEQHPVASMKERPQCSVQGQEIEDASGEVLCNSPLQSDLV